MNIKNLLLLSTLALATPLSAQEDAPQAPEKPLAEQVLEALPSVFSRAAEVMANPWEGSLNIVADSPEGSISGTVNCSYFHPRMFSFSLKMDLGGAEVDAVLIADDSYLNIEFSAPGAPAAQAFKLDLDVLQELQGNSESMDLATAGVDTEEIFGILASLDLKEEVSADGLTTTVKVDLSKLEIPEMGDEFDGATCELSFYSKTGFPMNLNLGHPAQGTIGLNFSDVVFPKEIDEEKYKYTPSEGVFPMNMTGMLRMQLQSMQAGGIGGGLDEEF